MNVGYRLTTSMNQQNSKTGFCYMVYSFIIFQFHFLEQQEKRNGREYN